MFSLWLNEGFASYMEYDCLSHIDPETGVLDRFVIEALQSVMENDALQTSHPISVTVHHPDEISEIFDGISYSKGIISTISSNYKIDFNDILGFSLKLPFFFV